MFLFLMHIIVYMFLPVITQIFIWIMKGQWLMHRDAKINRKWHYCKTLQILKSCLRKIGLYNLVIVTTMTL